MLWGVFVHSATVGDFGAGALAQQSSNLFRMALFFMISGFLGAHLLQRQSRSTFWTGRLRNLLVPLLFGLVVLNPPTLWLVQAHFGGGAASWQEVWNGLGGQGAEGSHRLIWHLHLWFLISLIAYVLIAPFASGAIGRAGAVLEGAVLESRSCRAAAPLVSVALLAGASVALRLLVEGAEAVLGAMPWLVRVTATYLPFYLFGMLLCSSARLRASILAPSWGLGIGVTAPFLASRNLGFDGPAATAAGEAALAAMRAWLSITIIRLGERWFSGRSRVTDLFSRSIYTVYILHYGLIYLLAFLLRDWVTFEGPAVYFGLTLSTIALGLLFHSLVVVPSPAMTFLFNGRIARPKTVTA